VFSLTSDPHPRFSSADFPSWDEQFKATTIRPFFHSSHAQQQNGGGRIGSWEETIAEAARHHRQKPGDESETRETSQMGGELSVRFRELFAEMNVLNSVAVIAR
jgi:hypothetical protein